MKLSSGSSGVGEGGLGGSVEKGGFVAFDIDFNCTPLIIYLDSLFRCDGFKLSSLFCISSKSCTSRFYRLSNVSFL